MDKITKEKLDAFISMHSSKLDSDLIDFVYNHFDEYLDGETQIDLLAQVAYEIGLKPKRGTIYEDYFKFLSDTFGLERDILEVGCGYFPAFASMIDKYQQEKGVGSIEAYDPYLVVAKEGKIKLHQKLFETLDNDKITLVTSIFPCEGSMTIIDEASKHNVEYSILMCECTPQKDFEWLYPFYTSPDMWLHRVHKHAQDMLPEDKELKVSFIDHADTPIIYTKRKR